ncbi:hypothetical protein IIB97_01390 [Patescibacteria group bacterium]|nr:hypothetical protein [Patescibacteria group bacterium]
MTKPLFPRSVRKHIRLQKARIRREIFDTAKKQELIAKLLERFLPKSKEEKPKKAAVKKKETAAATK